VQRKDLMMEDYLLMEQELMVVVDVVVLVLKVGEEEVLEQ
jgi:hypothetical protein